jgi:CMP-N,N'-diacetyllegionaminic acid synthase
VKLLAIIPARAGSKRLPGKNVKLFRGKSLVARTIEFAIKLNIFENILITTDSKEVLKVAKKYPVLVPWLRPKKLSMDNSSSIAFANHAINWYNVKFNKINAVVLLQPTSPFREIETFLKMLKIFKKNKQSVMTVDKNISSTKKIYIIKKNKLIKISKRNEANYKRNLFVKINGNLFFNTVANLKKFKNFTNPKSVPFLLKNPKEAVDIDTKEDWENAKKFK